MIFRTAGEADAPAGTYTDAILSRWHYADELSRELTLKDRSAIYGGFHLYMLQG